MKPLFYTTDALIELEKFTLFYEPEPSRGWSVLPVYDGSIADERFSRILRAMMADPEAGGHSDVGIQNLIFSLAINLRPRRVLEIGTHIGIGAVIIGHALKANGYGKLFTVEPAQHCRQRATQYILEAGVSNFIEVISDLSTSENCKNILREEYPYDLIFIDGSHQYADALHDIELCYSLLRPNGVIVLHDVGRLSSEFDQSGSGGARQALIDFRSKTPAARTIYLEHPLWLNPTGAALLCKEQLDPQPGS
jgi:predicted O-methyltransferase YrrM